MFKKDIIPIIRFQTITPISMIFKDSSSETNTKIFNPIREASGEEKIVPSPHTCMQYIPIQITNV